MKTLFGFCFFWSSLKFGGKTSSIFGEDVFFLLVLTYFAYVKKIVVERHPPIVGIRQSWGKIAKYPPNSQHTSKSAPLLISTCGWSSGKNLTWGGSQTGGQGGAQLIYCKFFLLYMHSGVGLGKIFLNGGMSQKLTLASQVGGLRAKPLSLRDFYVVLQK